MKTLTKFEAAMRGYKAISAPIHEVDDAGILASMEVSLATCDACWIACGNGKFEAARKASEIVEIDASTGDEIKSNRPNRRKIK